MSTPGTPPSVNMPGPGDAPKPVTADDLEDIVESATPDQKFPRTVKRIAQAATQEFIFEGVDIEANRIDYGLTYRAHDTLPHVLATNKSGTEAELDNTAQLPASRHGIPMSPRQSGKDRLGYTYKPRFLERKPKNVTISAQGAVDRDAEERHESHQAPIPTRQPHINFDKYPQLLQIDNLLALDERIKTEIKDRSDQLKDSRGGEDLTRNELTGISDDVEQEFTDAYIGQDTTPRFAQQITFYRRTAAQRQAHASEMQKRRELADEIQNHGEGDAGKDKRGELRDKDNELKAREQELRARELDQRERVLTLRDEALARGEVVDLPPSPSARERRSDSAKDEAMVDYQKRKARWDEQTATIDKYRQQPELADLFDDDRLRMLDENIQADVAPKYAAALRKRITELNANLPDDKKWKPIDDMTKEEQGETGKKLLTGKERGDIVNPIDDNYTLLYLRDEAGNRDLSLAISWYRRRLMGRSYEPKPPIKNK